MKRLVWLAAALGVSASLPAIPVAARGGPPGGFTIPAGATVSFTDIGFDGCNNLSWGYQLNGGADRVVASKPHCCLLSSAPSLVLGPFSTRQTLRVFLQDSTCSYTYYSDGTPVDHMIVWWNNPYFVRFSDGYLGCTRAATPWTDFQRYNLRVLVTIRAR